jgi:hypothetical protein
MITFWQWLDECQRLVHEERGASSGDQGYQAFIDQTNAEFRRMISVILRKGKFTDHRNEAEAKAIVADSSYFNYAQELLSAASGGRSRLKGQDVMDGAQEASGELWIHLFNPKLYEPKGATWESKNPLSAARGGIRGTIRSWARHKAGHFAARLHKRRTGVVTRQVSQIHKPGKLLDSPDRHTMSDFEWDDLRRAIIKDLKDQLQREIATHGPHWESRARNLRFAVEVVQAQMRFPWQWLSMPEAIQEVPGLKAKLTNGQGVLQRGGLVNTLKVIIDKARSKALGEGKQEERCGDVDTRCHNRASLTEQRTCLIDDARNRKWERTRTESAWVETNSFREFLATTREGLLVPARPSAIRSIINPFPALFANMKPKVLNPFKATLRPSVQAQKRLGKS